MQATAPRRSVPPAALAGDLFAVMLHLLKTSSHDVFRAVGDLDLSITQIKALHIVDTVADLSLRDLAERLGISLAAASRAVEGLHQRGLIDRREDCEDRRVKRVSATAAGREIIGRINTARLAVLEEFAASMTAEERAGLAAALAPIVARDEIAACRAARGAQ